MKSFNLLAIAALLAILILPCFTAQGEDAELLVDYQQLAETMEWKDPDEQRDDFFRQFGSELDAYQLELLRPSQPFFKGFTLCVKDDKELIHSFKAHRYTKFLERNGVLYHADFCTTTSGCSVVAFDLKARRQLWRTGLKGIPFVMHSEYENNVHFERLPGGVLAVHGKESHGNYLEIIDLKTGKTVGHRVVAEQK